MPRPFLLHCKSGADRAGFAAALYLLLRRGALGGGGAERSCHWRYLHLRGAATGVMHFMLERYAAESALEPMGFRAWVATRYDPEALMAEYRSGGGGGSARRQGLAAGVRVVSASPSTAARAV